MKRFVMASLLCAFVVTLASCGRDCKRGCRRCGCSFDGKVAIEQLVK